MSYHYAPLVPEGITKKECERGSLHFEPPITYVPPKCELTKEHGEHSVKVKMGKDVEESVPVFNGGIAEAHVACVQEQNRLLAQADLKKQWDGWNNEEQSAREDIEYELAVKPDGMTGDDASSKLAGGDNKQPSESIDDDARLKAWKGKYLTLQDKARNAKQAKTEVMKKAFHLCQTFLGEVPKTKWQNTVFETCQQSDWIDDKGEKGCGRGRTHVHAVLRLSSCSNANSRARGASHAAEQYARAAALPQG